MKKLLSPSSLVLGLTLILVLILTLAMVSAVTFTADATRSVAVPIAALGTVCLVDESGGCTDKTGEILFGDAIVENLEGDLTGLMLIQFGGNVYRATSASTIYALEVTTKEGKVITTDTYHREGMSEAEKWEEGEVIGFAGRLSQLLPDGNEIYTTGEADIYGDFKGMVESPVPVGRYYVEYEGLVWENSDDCVEIEGETITKEGITYPKRDCASIRGVVREGTYTNLELTFNLPGGIRDKYELVSIESTTNFEWVPEE